MNLRRQLLGAAALALISTLGNAQTYPDRELSGIIQWGAGGATDVVARSLVPLAEEAWAKKSCCKTRPAAWVPLPPTLSTSKPPTATPC